MKPKSILRVLAFFLSMLFLGIHQGQAQPLPPASNRSPLFTPLTVTGGPMDVIGTVGDINGDGFSEIAAKSSLGDDISIFSPRKGTRICNRTIPGLSGYIVPAVFTLGDLTGDGVSELLVKGANFHEIISGANCSTIVGGFWPTSTTWTFPLGDITVDKITDFMVTDGLSTSVDFYALKASGPRFIKRRTLVSYIPSLYGTRTTDLGDLNGDGFSEFVLSHRTPLIFPMRRDEIWDGQTLAPLVLLPPERYFKVITVGDVNGDGKRDLAMVRDAFPGEVLLYDTASLLATNTYNLLATYGFGSPHRIDDIFDAGDVNHDGGPDITIQYGFPIGVTPPAHGLTVSLLNGQYLSASQELPKQILGDLDGDGFPEYAQYNPGPVILGNVVRSDFGGLIYRGNFAASVFSMQIKYKAIQSPLGGPHLSDNIEVCAGPAFANQLISVGLSRAKVPAGVGTLPLLIDLNQPVVPGAPTFNLVANAQGCAILSMSYFYLIPGLALPQQSMFFQGALANSSGQLQFSPALEVTLPDL